MRKKLTIILLSFIFSSSLIIGNSFINTNSFLFIKKYVLLNCIYFFEFFIILFIFIKYIFDKLDNGKIKNYKLFNNKLFKLFDSHPFIFSFVFILLCWLIYIIAYYPIILSKDPSFQIKQFFNIPNKYSTYVNLLDKNVLLTNHHPVIHTLILGLCLKFGMLVKSTNIGLFIYSLIQVITLLSTLCYTIVFLKNLKVPKLYRFIILLIYAIVPFFPYYAMSAVKDVFLYVLLFYI